MSFGSTDKALERAANAEKQPQRESRLTGLTRRTGEAAQFALGLETRLGRLLSSLEPAPDGDMEEGGAGGRSGGLDAMAGDIGVIEDTYRRIACQIERLEELVGL